MVRRNVKCSQLNKKAEKQAKQRVTDGSNKLEIVPMKQDLTSLKSQDEKTKGKGKIRNWEQCLISGKE